MINGLEATVIGNVTRDPELTFTKSGKPVVKVGIAVNRVTGKAEDRNEKTIYVNAEAWDRFAENITETITKGMRVIATGHFDETTWKDRDGNERKSLVFKLDTIGPDLRYASAKVSKNPSSGGYSQSSYGNGSTTRVEEEPVPVSAEAPSEENPWF
jgi:single-strand DNA-binding protein